MPLAAGTKLGPYEILAPIGAGGMGEVYKARDTRLDRDVAIKISSEQFTERFEREARSIAALNHPNICHLYDVGPNYLVMELIDGAPLKGPLPLETVLSYAKQIADALEAAHDRGIIHRDLKPANILITSGGVIKILDFGLAKNADAPASDPESSPTMTISPTRAGMILGTAAYMAPEQARGKSVDKRADIWAFGVVLYEILSGKRLFEGETVSDILAGVLKEEPNLEGVPPRVKRLLQRCLEKNPRNRLRDVGDWALLLEESAVSAQAPKRRWLAWAIAATAAILASAITAVSLWSFKSTAPQSVSRFSIALGEEKTFTNIGRPVIAISPDGTRMAFVANQRLYLRPMTELEAKAIPGTENANGVTSPVFSPDGKSIVFFHLVDRVLKRIGVTGGAPVTLCPAENPWGMSWDNSGILYGAGDKGILRVSPDGGNPEVLVAVKEGEVAAHPQMLPGAQAVMFTLTTDKKDWDGAQIVVQQLKSGTRKTIVQGGSYARYLPTGHLVYFVGGTLLAEPFDLRRLDGTAGPVPILQGVKRDGFMGVAQIDFSSTGSMIYVPGPSVLSLATGSIALVDRKGATEPLPLQPGFYHYPRVSPDGKRLAYELDGAKDAAIWIYDFSGANAPRRLTFHGVNRYPVWSADGARVAFQSDREGDLGIFWQSADGTGAAERLTKPEPGFAHAPDSFSPDGQQLSFTASHGSASAVWTLSLRDRKATLFAESRSGLAEASMFSPDGRWVAYSVDLAGSTDNTVYVQAFPATPAKYQIAPGNGPVWSKDGKQIFFTTGPNSSAVVNVSTQGGFTFTSPTPVPRAAIISAPSGVRRFDVLPDGRFIGVVPPSANPTGTSFPPQIDVVLNWFEDLKQHVSAR